MKRPQFQVKSQKRDKKIAKTAAKLRARERAPLDEVGASGTRANAALNVADDTPLLETRTTPPSFKAAIVMLPPQGNETAFSS